MAGALKTQTAVSALLKQAISGFFLSEVKVLGFLLLFQALYNNILEGAWSLAETTEQTLCFVHGRRTKMVFT